MASTPQHEVELGNDIHGNLTRIDNTLRALPDRLLKSRNALADIYKQQE